MNKNRIDLFYAVRVYGRAIINAWFSWCCKIVSMINDGRKLKHDTLEEIHIRAVQRVESGESSEVVIKALGFHRSQIYKLQASAIQKRYSIITSNNLMQLNFEFALWARSMIRELRVDIG